jgi:hypothetical protein
MRSEVSNPHEFTMKRFGIHHIYLEENVLQSLHHYRVPRRRKLPGLEHTRNKAESLRLKNTRFTGRASATVGAPAYLGRSFDTRTRRNATTSTMPARRCATTSTTSGQIPHGYRLHLRRDLRPHWLRRTR